MIDLTPDGPQLTPIHKVPYFKRSCANLSKQRIPPHETDFSPDELFADDDNNRKDILGGRIISIRHDIRSKMVQNQQSQSWKFLLMINSHTRRSLASLLERIFEHRLKTSTR